MSHHTRPPAKKAPSGHKFALWLVASTLCGIVAGVLRDLISSKVGASLFDEEELAELAMGTGSVNFLPGLASFALIAVGSIAIALFCLQPLRWWQRWPVAIAAIVLGSSLIWVSAWNGWVIRGQGFVLAWCVTFLASTFGPRIFHSGNRKPPHRHKASPARTERHSSPHQ